MHDASNTAGHHVLASRSLCRIPGRCGRQCIPTRMICRTAALAALMILLLTGCNGGTSGGSLTQGDNPLLTDQMKSSRKLTAITAADFYASSAQSDGSAPPAKNGNAVPNVLPDGTDSSGQAPRHGADASADENNGGADTSGTDEVLSPAASTPETSSSPDHLVITNGLIGQVNGRPIYIEDFFRPIAAELALDGRHLSLKEFSNEVSRKVAQRLSEVIKNELLYSEAQASLTKDERVGLRYFLQNVESDMERPSGRIGADERLQKEYGLNLDESIEQARREVLIQEQMRINVLSRVFITWRDIERYYNSHYTEFNPPAAIELRLIVVPASDTSRCEDVKASLASGLPFEAVARKDSDFLPGKGGLLPASIALPGGLKGSRLTNWQEVDKLVWDLSQGQYAGPAQVGANSIWVYVEKYTDGKGQTLYQAQGQIEQLLRNRKVQELSLEYINKLRDRGSVDDFDKMLQTLSTIAILRWGNLSGMTPPTAANSGDADDDAPGASSSTTTPPPPPTDQSDAQK